MKAVPWTQATRACLAGTAGAMKSALPREGPVWDPGSSSARTQATQKSKKGRRFHLRLESLPPLDIKHHNETFAFSQTPS